MGLDIKGLSKDNLATEFPKYDKYKKSHLIGLQCVIGTVTWKTNRVGKDRKKW